MQRTWLHQQRLPGPWASAAAPQSGSGSVGLAVRAGGPTVGHGGGFRQALHRSSTPVSLSGRLSGRRAASSKEVELLEEVVAAKQEALAATKEALAATKKASFLEIQGLRTELALRRGILNMRGTMEEIEHVHRSTLTWEQRMKWGRKKVWGHLLADPQYQALAACFEELGWKQEDAPAQIAALYTLLSEHVHNKFQLSTQQVDIVEGVVNKEQAQAVQCMCRNLRWASSIMPAYSINGSTSGDSEQEE